MYSAFTVVRYCLSYMLEIMEEPFDSEQAAYSV
jgi:hypothetical protein